MADTRLLDTLTDNTPESRNRPVDLLRASAIVVVVLWHWTFSVTHWQDGRLTMPNPVDAVPGLWLLTWVLQVMPLFFVVGGFSNRAAYLAARRRGDVPLVFVRSRLRRLGKPVAVMVGSWLTLDTIVRLASPATPRVIEWGDIIFVPVWFIAIYGAITLLTPLTIRLDDRLGGAGVVLLGVTVLFLDIARFIFEVPAAGLPNSLLVFVFAHQLGHRWHAGLFDGPHRARNAQALLATGIALVAGLVVVGPYPASMVATRGADISNMFPTTAPIAALAVLQLGLIGLALPALGRLTARRGVWKATVAANAVAMTVFSWHMTALVGAIAVWQLLGGSLLAEPTAQWWQLRPVFVVLPAILLAPLVSVFGRAELPRSFKAPTT